MEKARFCSGPFFVLAAQSDASGRFAQIALKAIDRATDRSDHASTLHAHAPGKAAFSLQKGPKR